MERREFPREKVDIRTFIDIEKKDMIVTSEIKILDISYSGAGLMCEENISDLANCAVIIPTEESDASLKIAGKMVRKGFSEDNSSFIYGLKFDDFSKEQSKSIKEFLGN